ncbi:hypothetical protein [Photobacterium nomapromontoriensis]|uniref:hypothetical protein n=1 Tax=Photobacterium nomapromontoriensis TaxID=2910237 RepID=UPI003D123136
MNKYGLVCLSAVMLNPFSLAAAMDMESIFRLPALKIGIAKASGNVEVSHKGTFNDIPFNSSSSISPVITLIQPPVYFSPTSQWGYHTELNGGYFKLDYDDDEDKAYRDGEYKGYSVSFTPVLFYQWGDKNLCGTCKSWRVEVGAGVHYVNSEGELADENGTKTEFTSVGFGFNSHLGAVANYKQWEIGLRLVVPTRLDDSDIKIKHGLSAVSIGYRF